MTYLQGADRARYAADLRGQYEAGDTIRGICTREHRSYGFVRQLLLDGGTVLRDRGYALNTHPRGSAR